MAKIKLTKTASEFAPSHVTGWRSSRRPTLRVKPSDWPIVRAGCLPYSRRSATQRRRASLKIRTQ